MRQKSLNPVLSVELMDLPYYEAGQGRRDVVRLDANEGPSPPDSLLQELLQDAMSPLTYYPEIDSLVETAAAHYGVQAEQVMPVSGADEGIRLVMQAMGWSGGKVAIPCPTFPMYALYARMFGLELVEVPLGEKFRPDMPRFIATGSGANLLVVASPNNPDGRALQPEAIHELVDRCSRQLILLDETYAEFCGQNFLPLIDRYPNVVILRTLSKSRGLPGLRCGFLFASAAVMDRLQRLRSPYNMTSVAVSLGTGVLQRDTGFRDRLQRAVEARAHVQRCMMSKGFDSPPSDTHFCLLKMGGHCKAVNRYLTEHSIRIKDMGAVVPGFIRLSVANRAEAEVFLQQVEKWFSHQTATQSSGGRDE